MTTSRTLSILILAAASTALGWPIGAPRATEQDARAHVQDSAGTPAKPQDGGGDGRWQRGGDPPTGAAPRRGSEVQPDRRPDPRARWREIEVSAEDREIILEVIADIRPLSPQSAQQLRDMPAAEFREQVLQRAGRLIFLAGLKKTEPRLYEVKIEELKVGEMIAQAVRRYRDAADGQPPVPSAEQREHLRRLVARQQELRLRTREVEIALLEERLEQMRRSVDREREEAAQRVEIRVDELLSGREPHRSGPPTPGSGSHGGAGQPPARDR